MMRGSKVKPIVNHSPIPVPNTSRNVNNVKAGLDRDVRLEVLKSVPVGESVTWYHRMANCAKKMGSLGG